MKKFYIIVSLNGAVEKAMVGIMAGEWAGEPASEEQTLAVGRRIREHMTPEFKQAWGMGLVATPRVFATEEQALVLAGSMNAGKHGTNHFLWEVVEVGDA